MEPGYVAEPSPHGQSRSPLFVGREREQVVLRDALDAMLAGHGLLVLVSGEVGIGKTSLVEVLTTEAIARGCLVLTGHCYDLTTTPPYGPWLEITDRNRADDDLPELPEVLQLGTGGGDLSGQVALFDVARALFLATAERRPLVLVLEDMHWSDQASLDLLRFIARQAHDRRLLLVVTYRDDEVTRQHPLFRLLPTLVREAAAERVDLRPLEEASVRELVRVRYPVGRGEEARLVSYLQAHAEGNPLYLRELLRTLEEEALLRPVADGWALGDLRRAPTPPLVGQIIEGRLDRLSERTRMLLQVASIIGQEVQLDLWQAVSGVDEEEVLDAIEQAVGAHLLEEDRDGSRVRFSHALVREVLYDSVLSSRRRRWHREIAELLSQRSDTDPDVVATHFRHAGDRRAVDWLIRAGDRAEHVFALQTASERFEAAQALMAQDPARAELRGWLLFRLARTVRFTEHERALAYLNEAERIADTASIPVLRSASLAERGFVHWMAGSPAVALNEVTTGVAGYDGLSPEEREAGIAGFAALFTTNGEPDYARGERELLSVMESRRTTIVRTLAAVGQFRQALAMREEWEPRWQEPWLVAGRGNAHNGWAASHLALGRPDQALADLHETVRTSIEIKNFLVAASQLGFHLFWRHLWYNTDDLAERTRLVTEMVRLYYRAVEHGNAALPPAETHRHPVLLCEGQWSAAQLGAQDLLGHTQGQAHWHTRSLDAGHHRTPSWPIQSRLGGDRDRPAGWTSD